MNGRDEQDIQAEVLAAEKELEGRRKALLVAIKNDPTLSETQKEANLEKEEEFLLMMGTAIKKMKELSVELSPQNAHRFSQDEREVERGRLAEIAVCIKNLIVKPSDETVKALIERTNQENEEDLQMFFKLAQEDLSDQKPQARSIGHKIAEIVGFALAGVVLLAPALVFATITAVAAGPFMLLAEKLRDMELKNLDEVQSKKHSVLTSVVGFFPNNTQYAKPEQVTQLLTLLEDSKQTESKGYGRLVASALQAIKSPEGRMKPATAEQLGKIIDNILPHATEPVQRKLSTFKGETLKLPLQKEPPESRTETRRSLK